MSELEIIEDIPQFVDENTYARVCLYMVSMVLSVVQPDSEHDRLRKLVVADVDRVGGSKELLIFIDLMSELEIIEDIPQFVDENTYARVCLYMVSMVNS
jgi:hypothetical protein